MASAGGIGGAEVVANRYDPDDLEAGIEAYRFSGRWEEALGALERYAQVFDIGAAAYTKQHHTSEEARSYYWSVMAEAMLEYRADADQSLLCLGKAAQYNPSSPDWRILACRAILRSAAPVLVPHPDQFDQQQQQQEQQQRSIPGAATPDAKTVLLEALQSFTQQDAEFLLSTVESIAPSSVRRHLLKLLSILPSMDVVFICQDLLEGLVSAGEGAGGGFGGAATLQCCLVTVRNVLRQVPIGGSLAMYFSQRMSDYRFWLLMDAAATRSVIHEQLGNRAAARADALAVLREISPFGSEVSRVRGAVDGVGAGSVGGGAQREDAGGGQQQSPCILEAVCGPARRTALYLAARLPLLERDMGLTHECYRSFRRCVGADSYFRPYIPTRLVLGLRIECALVLLEYAARSEMSAGAGAGSSGGNVGAAKSADDETYTYNSSVPEEDTDIALNTEVNLETALLLLRSCHETMSIEPSVMLRENSFTSHTKGDQFVDIEFSWGERVGHNFVESEPSIELLPQSMIKCLDEVPSDPLRCLYVATPSHVAYLIAGILTKTILNFEERSYKDRKLATEVFEILHWGISNETTPPLNLLWSLARSYVEVSSLGMVGSSRLGSNAVSNADSAPMRLEGFDDYFGGQEIETAINLLDQCISIVLHNENSPSTDGSSAVPLRDVEYPLISEWFGLGFQPSVHHWLPFSLAADLCLNSLEDAPRSLVYANKGLEFMFSKCHVPVYLVDILRLEAPGSETTSMSGDKDPTSVIQRVLPFGVKLLDKKCYLQSIQPFVSCKEASFECMDHGHTASFEAELVSVIMGDGVYPHISISEDDLLGIRHLLFTAARAQAAWSRSSALLAPERSLHRSAALRVVGVMLRGMKLLKNSTIDASELEKLRDSPGALSAASTRHRYIPAEDIILEYAVLLIESGDIQGAASVVNDSLVVLESSHRLFHLQGLILDTLATSGSGDEDVATNLAIIRTASNISKQSNCWNNLNVMVTQSKMHWKQGNIEVSIRIMDDILSKLQDLTRNRLLFPVTFFRASHDVYHSISSHNAFRRVAFLIETLISASKLFRSVNNFDKASACVQDAWRILYAGEEVPPSSSAATSRSVGAALDEASHCGGETGPAVGDVDSISYWVNALRSVPTFEGWRLAQGSGWATDTLQWRRAVSSIAEETAQLILVGATMSADSILKNVQGMLLRRYSFEIDEDRLASASRRDDSLTFAWEFLALSVAVDPTNPRALLSCCKFELERMEEEAELEGASLKSPINPAAAQFDFSREHHRETADLDFNFGHQRCDDHRRPEATLLDVSRTLKCIDLASRAIEYNENDSEAWLVLGAAYERARQGERAAECFLRAVEREGQVPLRDFAVALIEA